MKISLIVLMLLPLPVAAGDALMPVNNTTQLEEWCRLKSAEFYYARDITPYNWTSSWWNEGDALFVKGEWLADNKKQIVHCRTLSGAPRKFAFIEMPGQDITGLTYSMETPINNTTELEAWCRYNSARYFLSRNQVPYNWSFSHWSEGNFLYVKGSWTARRHHEVTCKVRVGVAEKYATMQVSNE